MDFLGRDEDYNHLRDCVIALRDMGITSGVLLKAVDSQTSRQALDRFRKGSTSRLGRALAEDLWNHIKVSYPVVFELPGIFVSGADANEMLFALLKRFFELKDPRVKDFASRFSGRYICYTLSSMKSPNPYVTVSEMEITQSKSGALRMIETQEYRADGELLKETYSGFCLPKGTSKMMLAHDAEHNSRPRLYYITDDMDTAVDGKQKNAFFRGFVIAYSKNSGGVFQGNFFCRRLKHRHTFEKTIIHRSALKDADVDEWIFQGQE